MCPEIPFIPELPEQGGMLRSIFARSEAFMARENAAIADDGWIKFVEALEQLEFRNIAMESWWRQFITSCNGSPRTAVKGQLVGPLTMLTGITYKGRPLRSRTDIFQLTVDFLCAAARILSQNLQQVNPVAIVVLDEPMLPTWHDDQARKLLATVLRAIRSHGALAGLHCCGLLHPTMLTGLEVDVLSFDPRATFQGMVHGSNVSADWHVLLQRTPIVVWGAVPNGTARDKFDPVLGVNEVFDWLRAVAIESASESPSEPTVRLRSSCVSAACGLVLEGIAGAEASRDALQKTTVEFRRRFSL